MRSPVLLWSALGTGGSCLPVSMATTQKCTAKHCCNLFLFLTFQCRATFCGTTPLSCLASRNTLQKLGTAWKFPIGQLKTAAKRGVLSLLIAKQFIKSQEDGGSEKGGGLASFDRGMVCQTMFSLQKQLLKEINGWESLNPHWKGLYDFIHSHLADSLKKKKQEKDNKKPPNKNNIPCSEIN